MTGDAIIALQKQSARGIDALKDIAAALGLKLRTETTWSETTGDAIVTFVFE